MLNDVATFLFDSGKRFFDSFLSDWGIIGYAIIAAFVIPRVTNFMKRMFK